jgi:hypothetical protein
MSFLVLRHGGFVGSGYSGSRSLLQRANYRPRPYFDYSVGFGRSVCMAISLKSLSLVGEVQIPSCPIFHGQLADVLPVASL